jgi:hypothetical protein
MKNLIARKSSFEVLAITRNAQSPSAQKLAKLSSSIKLVEGNMNDPTVIFQNTRRVAKSPI